MARSWGALGQPVPMVRAGELNVGSLSDSWGRKWSSGLLVRMGTFRSRVVALWNPGGEMGNVWYPWLQLDTGTSSMGVTDEGRAV